MKVLIVEPGKYPREADIPSGLQSLQETVGGYIQAIYPFDDPVALVCDEEGLLKQKVFNRYVCEGCAVHGTFFICGLDTEDFTDLPDALMQKYKERFYAPEILIKTPAGYNWIRLR